jgi:hypothetical protein
MRIARLLIEAHRIIHSRTFRASPETLGVHSLYGFFEVQPYWFVANTSGAVGPDFDGLGKTKKGQVNAIVVES